MQILDQADFGRRIDEKLSLIPNKELRDRAACKLAHELLELATWVLDNVNGRPRPTSPTPDRIEAGDRTSGRLATLPGQNSE